jgi:hypothetical protein
LTGSVLPPPAVTSSIITEYISILNVTTMSSTQPV